MHVSYKFGHQYVDVLTEQLVRSVTNDVRNFGGGVLDDSNVLPLAWDDDSRTDRIVSVLFFLNITLDFETLTECPFSSLYSLLTPIVDFVVIDDHLHKIGVEDHAMDIVRVYMH